MIPLRFFNYRATVEQSLDHWLITGTLGGMQGYQGSQKMDHAHNTESVMAWAARNEMKPAAPKSKDPAAKEPGTAHAIDPLGW